MQMCVNIIIQYHDLKEVEYQLMDSVQYDYYQRSPLHTSYNIDDIISSGRSNIISPISISLLVTLNDNETLSSMVILNIDRHFVLSSNIT